MDNKITKYRLTYPYVSNNIYESRIFDSAVNKCFKEFKQFNDIRDGMFIVTDVDNKIEHKFRVQNKKISQLGGVNKDLEQIDNISLLNKIDDEDNSSTSSPVSLDL